MELYSTLKTLHVIGAMVLLGTGAGIAFFMLMAHRSRDVAFIARTASVVVVADALFTATAAVTQPLSGVWLADLAGLPLTSGWIGISLILYVLVGCLWLPVVVIRIRMRNLAREALASGRDLPEAYDKLFRVWFICGLIAFPMVVATTWLMVAKPS